MAEPTLIKTDPDSVSENTEPQTDRAQGVKGEQTQQNQKGLESTEGVKAVEPEPLETDSFLNALIENNQNKAPAQETNQADVEALQQLIAEGADPTQLLEETAAGEGEPTDGGGIYIPTIDRTAEEVLADTGFDTTATGSVNVVEEELLLDPRIPVLPVVSVSLAEDGALAVTEGSGSTVTLENPVIVEGNAVSVLEGTSESTKQVTFVISLNKVFDKGVQVTYELRSFSADNPEDWFNGDVINTVTIPTGETTLLVTVEIVEDHLVEGDEQFDIVLVDAVNATINPEVNSVVITIYDDDNLPEAFNDSYVTEEDTPITISTGSGVLLNDTGADNGEVLTVTGFEQPANGTVTLNEDGSFTYTPAADFNGQDSFTYAMTDGFNGESSATVSINVTPDLPTVIVEGTGVEGTTVEEGNFALFTVKLSEAHESALTVDLSLTNGTADDSDYDTTQFFDINGNPIGNSVTFAVGVTSIDVYVQTIENDPDGEALENYTVTATLAGSNSASVLGGITDPALPPPPPPPPPPDPTINIGDASTVEEGNVLAYTVTLNGASDTVVTTNLNISGGTATGGDGTDSSHDYTSVIYDAAAGGNAITALTFAIGETSKTIYVRTINNDPPFAESDETVIVTLSGISGANQGTTTGSGTITDGTAPVINISDASTVEEGNVLAYTVTLNGASDTVVTTNLNISGGTATGGDGTDSSHDYTSVIYDAAAGGNAITALTFAIGETSKTIYVRTINNDPPFAESAETVIVTLSGISGATAGTTTASGTIIDQTLPTINISGGDTEEEGGVLAYTVGISGASEGAVNATLGFGSGTASADDYTAKFYSDAATTNEITSVSFAAGNTADQTIYVRTLDNDPPFAEGSETVIVTLSGISGATAGTTTASGTIIDQTLPTSLDTANSVDEADLDLILDANDLAIGTSMGTTPSEDGETVTGSLNLQSGWTAVASSGTTSDGNKYQINADGTYVYTLVNAADHSGGVVVDSIDYTVTNGVGIQTNTLTITINNDAPTAVNDGVLGSVDDNVIGVTTGTVSDLLSNDSYGADGEASSDAITIAGGSLGGTVTISGNNIVYTSATDVAPGATATETFTYTIKDADGDITTATFTVELTDGKATIGTPVDSAVDEEGLSDGNAGDSYSSGDLVGEAISVSNVDLDIDYGVDGAGGVTFDATQTALTNLSLKSGGATVKFVQLSNSTVLVGYIGGTAPTAGNYTTDASVVFYAELDSTGTGSYDFTLKQVLDHATANSEDDIDLVFAFTAVDAEGEGGNSSFTVTVDDDGPVTFTPESASIVNLAGNAFEFNIDFEAAAGADGVGNVVFTTADATPLLDTNGEVITFGGQAVYLYNKSAGNVIEGRTSNVDENSGDLAFTATLIPGTDTYSIDLEGVLRNNPSFSFETANGIGGGNTTFFAMGIGSGNENDVLVSGNNQTVNNSTGNIGIGTGQNIGSGDTARFDMVKNIVSDNGSTASHSGHYEISTYIQEISKVQGGGE
ncbi:MAG TPA: retention module-containing protein [Methylococcaceae bacterium]|nr:retention module-containing protein [Methylococcaceae bacterium]